MCNNNVGAMFDQNGVLSDNEQKEDEGFAEEDICLDDDAAASTAFLHHLDVIDSGERAEQIEIVDIEESHEEIVYNKHKPRWWRTVSGKVTKAQRRAIASMKSTHHVDRVPYGEFLDWEAIFGNKCQNIWLELGCGTGDNILCLAHRYQDADVQLLGVDIHLPGIGKAYQRMYEAIESRDYWTGYTLYSNEIDPRSHCDTDDYSNTTCATKDNPADNECRRLPYENVRLCNADGINLLPSVPSGTISVILITFPDPFPKSEQKAFRIIQAGTLRSFHRVLKPSGRLYLATDHEGFYQWSLSTLDQVNNKTSNEPLFHQVQPCPDRHLWLPAVSKYEKRGWEEGRKTYMVCCEKV